MDNRGRSMVGRPFVAAYLVDTHMLHGDALERVNCVDDPMKHLNAINHFQTMPAKIKGRLRQAQNGQNRLNTDK
jgi:hypothetical protein